MRANHRDIVLVNYELPNGQFKPHPVLILSCDDINTYEEQYIVVMLSTTPTVDDYSFLLNNDMFNFTFQPKLKSSSHKAQIRCHLITNISENEIERRYGSMKKKYFCQVIEQINSIVFDCN